MDCAAARRKAVAGKINHAVSHLDAFALEFLNFLRRTAGKPESARAPVRTDHTVARGARIAILGKDRTDMAPRPRPADCPRHISVRGDPAARDASRGGVNAFG